MVNYKDLGITSQTFKDYVAFGYGEFKVSNSQIVNFGILNADGTLNEAETQKVMDMMGTKALRIIKRSLDTNKILTIFNFADFNVDYQAAIVETVLDQIEGLITDGPFEVKNGSSYSGQGADVQTDISGFLLSQDRLYKSTEDTWYEAALDEVNIAVDEDGNYILTDETLGNVFNFKFQSGQSVGQVNLTGSGMEILTADEINNVLNAKIVSNKEFVGTYEASDAADVANLDTAFKGAGLVLTNGTTFQQATANIGQAIKVTVPSVPTFKHEQYEWDGSTLEAITYNNLEDAELKAVEAKADANTLNKKDKAEFDSQLDIDVAVGNGILTQKLIGILKPLVSKETLDYFINGLDERATDLESATADMDTLLTNARALLDQHEQTIAQLGAKAVSGGTLLSTAEVLATEKFVADEILKVVADVTTNKSDIVALKAKDIDLQAEITSLQGRGTYRGTYKDIASAEAAITSPNNGDFVAIGNQVPYIEWIYNASNQTWEEAGVHQTTGKAIFKDGTETSTQSGAANSKAEQKVIDDKLSKNMSDGDARVLAAAKADAASQIAALPIIPTGYEEKEITITPAVYDWKTITKDNITVNDVGKKLILWYDGDKSISGLISIWNADLLIFYIGQHFNLVGKLQFVSWVSNYDKISLRGNAIENKDIDKIQIWDIITPAVKATVLVKK